MDGMKTKCPDSRQAYEHRTGPRASRGARIGVFVSLTIGRQARRQPQ